MKNFLIFAFFLLFLTSCSNKNIAKIAQILDENATGSDRIILLDLGEQNITILPKSKIVANFDGKLLLKNRFLPFDYQIKKGDEKEAFWAFEIYKADAKRRYFGSNFRPLSKDWYEKQNLNANKADFGKLSRLAVTIANTQLRNYPTDEPIFYNPQNAGEGYPFDYLQASSISISYPLFVSHLSLDGAWALVKDDVVWGWVKLSDIKFIDKNEANALRNSQFLTILKDKTPIYSVGGEFLFNARVGAILPFNHNKNGEFFGVIATKNGIKNYKISSEFADVYPLKFDDENVRKIASSMLNEPYGWGGFNLLRDCSLLTKDFFASFGIWLPRNSSKQALVGEKISLENLTNSQKIALIKEKAVPYLTLFHSPGHIMIYAGFIGDKILIYHDAWGIKTRQNGRALIGQVALTSLDIGSDLAQIDEKSLLISKIKSMNILMPKDDKKERLKRAYDVEILGDFVVFKSGKKVLFDDKKVKNSDCESGADIDDMLGVYSAFKPLNTPLSDVGRCRNYELLGEIYGKNQDEVKKNLVDVVWLKDFDNIKLKFNAKNNAAKAFKALSDELNEMVKNDKDLLKFLTNPGGSFKWRKIANTNRLSPHSYGIAVDINVSHSHYWQWHKNYTNLIPLKIVLAFEKHGFIWGGRWVHFDTMHFEYRPELF